MPFLRPYNALLVTGTTGIRIPIIKRASVDFAIGADWSPAAGDVTVKTGAGASGNITNLPTAIARGNTAEWEFILTAAELSGKTVTVLIADAATKLIEDQCFIVETYGNASAMYQADLSAANLPANATQFAGQTITAGAGVTIPSSIASPTNITAGVITTVTTVTNQLTAAAIATGVWQDTTAGDFTVALSVGKSVMNGVALGTGLTINAYTGNTVQTGDSFARIGAAGAGLTNIGTIATVTNLTNLPAITANWLTAAGTAADFGAEVATAVWTDITAGDFTVALSIGKSVMNGVALGTGLTINAYTGNTVQTGDSFARIGAAGAGLTAIDLPNQTMDIIGNITGNLSGSVGSVTGAVGSVTGLTAATVHSDLDDIQTRLPAALTGAGNIKADTLAINGSTTAATVLAILNGTTVVYQGTATGAVTTTTLIDSGLTQADTDWWKGRIIIFTSVIAMQATDITAFDPATDKLTFTAVTASPTAATYVII